MNKGPWSNIPIAQGNVAACSPNFLNTPPLPYPGNDQYKSLGCYTEPADARALTGKSYFSTTDMTAEACIGFCAGSIYAAAEYASECYCGSGMITTLPMYSDYNQCWPPYLDLNSGSIPVPSADCAMTCSVDRWEVCGGSRRINCMFSPCARGPALSWPFWTVYQRNWRIELGDFVLLAITLSKLNRSEELLKLSQVKVA